MRTNVTTAGGAAWGEWLSAADMATDTDGCHIQALVRIDTGINLGADGSLVYMTTLLDGDDSFRCSAFIYTVSGIPYLILSYQDSGGQQNDAAGWNYPLTKGTTYRIEIAYKEHGSAGYAKLWLDGTLTHDNTSKNTGSLPVKKGCVGQRLNVA
ncbi:hypothetical protein A2617_00230 [Candidatus Daviesbacteria bacterium RIFOXYD1_FULL_41_10]|uniref:Uncharacterized protein n=1 Tax=Candidatus Daviesbacteria bacterium RIFOXYD1_FULL_41_10 TaxID=1797801 RepID=A0A1F5MZN2_9BACT|nr:MAG: hypothetical protein A2617_00230 [Candidatus Daviesbacteria bacterium RIFOXYD1_FULL_41_10]